MNGTDLIRRLHQHRAWVNRKLIDSAEALSVEERQQPFPIGQGSIWKSLLHLHAAEFVWLESLLGNEEPLLKGDLPGRIPGNQEGAGAMQSLDELKARWHELESRWQTYLESLQEADLDQIVYKVSSQQGKRHGTCRGDILLHVCTHAQYTTAQVVNMLRRVDAQQLPETMLITMARQETATA